MLNHIQHRWENWISSTHGRRRIQRWGELHPSLRAWSVEELRSPTSSRRTDAMQAALVELAQTGDQEAVSTLLMQLRPGLLRLIGWMAVGFGRGRERHELEDEVVGMLCETIMRHPLERRPRRIAANLLLDTRQALWRGGLRDVRIRNAAESMVTIAPAGAYGSESPEEIVGELDVVDTLAEAIDSLPGTTASRQLTGELAYRAWILDETNHDIAADIGLHPDVVRTRLSRLRSRIGRPQVGSANGTRQLSRSGSASGHR